MKVPTQAIILLAGSGSRLGVYTEKIPKCMVEVADKPLLIRLLSQLEKMGVQQAILVVGYKAELIKEIVGNSYGKLFINYVENKVWETTNNIVSLNLAIDLLSTNFFLLEGDLFFSNGVLEKLSEENSMAVDHYKAGMNGTVIVSNDNGYVKKIYLENNPNRPDRYDKLFKTVNAYSMVYEIFKKELAPRIQQLIDNGQKNIYYEQAFADATDDGIVSFKIVKLEQKDWCEIDTEEDLLKAREIFNT